MDRADITLGFLLAYIVAATLHAALAASIQRRKYRATEVRVFAAANWMLAAWHVLQGIEYTQALDLVELRPDVLRGLLGAQILVGLLVLALFFQLFATFERIYRRQAPSLRAAITTHVHRHRRVYIPAIYLAVVAAAGLYVVDATGVGSWLGAVREHVGPTSAYLFGGSLLFMTFVLFPARPGQEKIPAPTLGRAALLLSLAVTLVLIAAWHDLHPKRTQLALIPWLNLQSVAFCIFLAFLRYEFSFLDTFLEGALRLMTWAGVVLLCYYAYNRLQFTDPDFGRYATSLSRIGVLLAAVGLGPWLGDRVARWSDRSLFGRDADLESLLHRYAARLANSATLAELVEGTSRDIARAVHVKEVRVIVGGSLSPDLDESSPSRLRIPMVNGGNTVGWLLLGERRNLYPYFETERRHLQVVAELLGAAIVSLRARGDSAPDPAPAEGGAAEPPPDAAPSTPPRSRERAALDPEWVAEVVEVGHDVADRSPTVAVEVLRRLHRMQAHLEEAQSPLVELDEELAFARDYLALEKLRLRNRLEVDLGVDPQAQGVRVPRGVLHPLLENAFAHGVGSQLRGGRVEVHAGLAGSDVVLTVLDNGGGFPMGFDTEQLPEGSLARLRRRLAGDGGGELVIETASVDGGEVSVRLPRG